MTLRPWMLVAASFAASTLHAGDWPQFLGPNRDGTSVETGLIESIPSDGLKALWRIPAGGGYAGPVAVGDRVLLFHFNEGKEILQAFRAADGKSIWETSYSCDYAGGMFREPGPRATPTITGDSVVTLGPDGVLQRVAVSDGALRWRHELHKRFTVPESYFGVACSPLVVDELVLVNVGSRQGAGLCAFRMTDGSLAWSATNDSASYSSPILANLGHRPTALFLARSGLHGVDPKTGTEHFFIPFRARMDASVNAATPIAWKDHFFLTASYGVGAALYECKDQMPKVVWSSKDVLSAHFNTPVKIGEYLYGIDGRQEGGDARLVCIEARTGAVQWAESQVGCASIIAADGKLFVLKESGQILLCRSSPKRFHRLGTFQAAGGLCRAAPALAFGKVYIHSDRELVCLDVRKKS